MNPLTQIKNTQKASQREIADGVADSASWHAKFKHSAYIFVGGLDYTLTEGDLLAVFAQYGEIVDVNLVRDQDTGKPRGFAFLAYEDQRSTVLAVDNLSGAKVAGRIVTVNHVDNYKVKRAEMEGREVSPDMEEEGLEQEKERHGVVLGADAAAGDTPWTNGNSVFSLMSTGEGLAPSVLAQGLLHSSEGKAARKEKRKKDKTEKVMKKAKKGKHGKRAKLERPGPISSDSEDECPSPTAVPSAATGRPARERKPGGNDRDERSAGGRTNVDGTWQEQLKDRGRRGAGAGERSGGAMPCGGGDRRGRDEQGVPGGYRRDEREGKLGGTISRRDREDERQRRGRVDAERPRRRSRSRSPRR